MGRNILQKLEDIWYGFLDQIDSFIPVYRIIDPLDKIVPSFYLLMGLIFLGILSLMISTPSIPTGYSNVVLEFTDQEGNHLLGLPVMVSNGEMEKEYLTNAKGIILLKGLTEGQTLSLSSSNEQYHFPPQTILVSNKKSSYSFTLIKKTIPFEPVAFQFVDEHGILLEGKKITLETICPTLPELPYQTSTTQNGIFILENNENCTEWYTTISSPGFATQENVLLDPANPVITITHMVAVTGTITVDLQSAQTQQAAKGIRIQLYTHDGILTSETFSDEKGKGLLEKIPYGKYYLSLFDPEGTFSSASGNEFTLDLKETVSQSFFLIPGKIGKLNVNVKDETNGVAIENALVKIQEKDSLKILATLQTNTKGKIVNWSPNQKGEVNVIVTHPSYIPQTQPLTVGEGDVEWDFSLSPANPQIASSIHVRVVDASGMVVGNVQLVLYASETKTVVQETNPILTDADGNATFENVPAGNYFIRATKYPFPSVDSSNIAVESGSTQNIEMILNTSEEEVMEWYWEEPPQETQESCEPACNPTFTIAVSPSETIVPFEPGTYEVSFHTDTNESAEATTVYISMRDPTTGMEILFLQSMTNAQGKISLVLPGLLPGTGIRIVGYHPVYGITEKEIIVEKDPIEITPVLAVFDLPYSPFISVDRNIFIHNLIPNSLKVVKGQLAGDPEGWVHHSQTLSQTLSHFGTPILPGATQAYALTIVTPTIIPKVIGAKTSGLFILTFQSETSSQKWVKKIPFLANYITPGECDEKILTMTGVQDGFFLNVPLFQTHSEKKWGITNECTVDGKSAILHHVEAEIEWEGKPLGFIQMKIIPSTGGDGFAETISPGKKIPLISEIKTGNEETYEGTIAFIPYSPYMGETGKVKLTLWGDSGPGGQPFILYQTEIEVRVSRLETCVKTTPTYPDPIQMDGNKTTVEFEIDTTFCGVPIDIQFCSESGNEKCSGGAEEGKIGLSEWKINQLQGHKKITIERTGETLPGEYDITIHARANGQSYQRLARITTHIAPPESYAFDLTKPHFTVIGKNAEDSSDVINRLLEENIEVTAALCIWMKKMNDGPGFAERLKGNAGIGQGIAVYAGLACGAPCFFLAWYGTLIYTLLSGGGETIDLCAIDITVSGYVDYIINLKGAEDEASASDSPGPGALEPDAIAATLSGKNANSFSAKWVLENPTNEETNEPILDQNQSTEGPIQIVGVVITSKKGIAIDEPSFLTLSLHATEHIHGDVEHSGNAAVTCTNEFFYNYWIGPEAEQGACTPAEDVERIEKYHIRVKTSEIPNTLSPPGNKQVCTSGYVNGYSGTDALPRVAFNWRWDEAKGIPILGCDAENPAGVYCDATQFTIDILKRVRAYEEFLAANNYAFDCPKKGDATPDSQTIPNPGLSQPHEVIIPSFAYKIQKSDIIAFSGIVENHSLEPVPVTLDVYLVSASDFTITPEALNATPYHCTISEPVAAGATQTIGCAIGNIPTDSYLVIWKAVHTTSGMALAANTWELNLKKYGEEYQNSCDLTHTTGLINGKPAIGEFIDSTDPEYGDLVTDGSIAYTPTITSASDIDRLFHFEANLIRDGFSTDFENDFRKYYLNNSFANAPAWFKGNASTPGYASFFGEDDILTFREKYTGKNQLPAAGKYRVDIEVESTGEEDWRFFSQSGEPQVKITLHFIHENEPFPNSPFYRLPFDGELGLENNVYSRNGYGMDYIGNPADDLLLNEFPTVIHPQPGAGNSTHLQVSKPTSLGVLHHDPATRGNILRVFAPTGLESAGLVFSPSMATPVLTKITHVTEEPFSVFYQLSVGGEPVTLGNNLTYWTGVPACGDFSGNYSTEVFNETPDRVGKVTDKKTNWNVLYALDWNNVQKKGSEYMYTIFYTPTLENYSLSADGTGVEFFTPNNGNYSPFQSLDGINDIPFNNASFTVDSIQDVFDMVAEGDVCVEDNGTEARFVWNTYQLLNSGKKPIQNQLDGLVPGSTCIAPTLPT